VSESSSHSVDRLEITKPDDFHVHFRDGPMLQAVVKETARHFSRAIVMPNLVPPVVNAGQASAYRERILAATNGYELEPLMTLYLTDTTTREDLKEASALGFVKALKLYPAGATTNSDSGVTDISRIMPVLETMAELGLVLCVHGEVTDPDIDIFDREAVFIERILSPIKQAIPELRVVMEHITTKEGAEFVSSGAPNLAATITTQHLMLNRNDMLVGGIRPHYYCLPILKREEHRQALRKAAISGDTRYFLGTDSAPHSTDTKEAACGCAGVFNATNTMACVAQVFDEEESLDKLEGFCSSHGAKFYGLPQNSGSLVLERQSQPVQFESSIPVPGLVSGSGGSAGDGGEETVTVFDPGQDVFWSVVGG